MPPAKRKTQKKVIFFDLDETLVHCVDEEDRDTAEVVLTVEFPNGEVAKAGINVRPYARKCLEEAAEHFQVVIFTASHKAYADVVLDHLDPKHELI